MDFLKNLFGDDSSREVGRIMKIVEKVNAFEPEISKLSDEELRGKTAEFKDRLAQGATLDDILPEAFAVVREASQRTLKQRHYDVQLVGGVVLHEGSIAEMRTGEGKTLVATLPTYLNALTGKGVHVVTVNDYLSRRDAVWVGQIPAFLGLTVGVITTDGSYIYDPAHKDLDQERDEVGAFKVVHEFLRPVSRREAYEADITYGTNNEFGFDYLRDNLAYSKDQVRQRGYHYAVVDEIDSILIDESRTPLIISMPAQESERLYETFADIVSKLKVDEDYTVDEKLHAIQMTDEGITKAEKMLGVENIYTDRGIKYVHHLETAVRAKALYTRDKEYVVRDGEVIIVDTFTGRLQPGRRWSEGLHQAIEAKEGVHVQKESRTAASITFQNYFRFYEKLSGMTGTAKTSAEEFYKVYELPVVTIPTNKPTIRKDDNDLIFQTENGKFRALARKVKELNEKGQPVLIGTVSIEKNELLSEYLNKEGIKHTVLNAKNHEREGEIIAQAGQKGGVTVATNMAGRGVDIKLGGSPSTDEEYEEVKNLGGLYVIGTERHEARRIDNQLRGRAGRQGDPGETQFYVSLEDSLMRVFGSDRIKGMMGRFGIPEDEPIENRLINRSLESAQEKIEGFHFDARKHVLEFDDVLNYQRKIVYERRRAILFADKAELTAHIQSEVFDPAPDEIRPGLEAKRRQLGEDLFLEAMRAVILQTIDMYWIDHLETMDYLRNSVNLRAYGQRDPLVEYKREGLRLFKEMQDAIRDQTWAVIPNIGGPVPTEEEKPLQATHESVLSVDQSANSAPSVAAKDESGEKVGRNDLCPCNSGKKYKNCGLLNTEEHKKNMAVKK
ncbi:MAG TPA: preprotein translocase subunit SecA [Candidatus Paceibacterota bacterium]|nr:preprotein translocase subunit SecA [Candidatus Paceibacterota bacterium]